MPNTNRPTISTHVLDTTRGEPAAGVAVTLSRLDGKNAVALGSAQETDADGRIGSLGDGTLAAGTYRLSFEVGAYYKKKALASFLDRVTIDFHVAGAGKYHIPLLMSPFACSSYRGS